MPISVPQFSSMLVPHVLTYLGQRGVDPSNLAPPGSAEGRAVVSLDDIERLLEGGAKRLADPLFGLHVAEAMPRGAYGFVEFCLRSAPTGRRGLEQLAAFGPVINPLVRWGIEADGDEVAIVHRPQRRGGVGRQGNLLTVARIVRTARELLGSELNPRRAWFAHAEPRAPQELEATLRADTIAFGRASNGVSFATKDLERRPVEFDAELNRALSRVAEDLVPALGTGTLVERTRATVLALFPETPTLAVVARRLAMGERTFQRRLEDEGVSFADLVTHTRREHAERLLERSDLTITEIGGRVGYRDPAAFVRAFRRWTKRTPGTYREDLASRASA
ncbi:MAG: AraC family transcriptional regulator ligand-binding domain-containing protein [Deltaproteobacteria bacterium]|nr:AraC family transcriptional regulator ligand-binding domain-containing protein [Deltaproteobacteria bacterium]